MVSQEISWGSMNYFKQVKLRKFVEGICAGDIPDEVEDMSFKVT